MKKAVRMVKPAEKEMFDAAVYYELQVAGLGQDFLDRMASAVADIGENPERWPIVMQNISVASCTDFHMAYSIEWMRMKLSCSQSPTFTDIPPTGSEDYNFLTGVPGESQQLARDPQVQ